MSIPRVENPISLFNDWFHEAEQCPEIDDHTAMMLATVNADGAPDLRTLLLKGVDERGFVFYTNLGSPKAQHLALHPCAAICFYWMPLEKQVRIRGAIEPVSDEEADAYFATRPRESQLGAWASIQSQPLTKRFELERRIAQFVVKFNIGKVPRPPFWSGFRLKPDAIEFWIKKPFRLHERLLYTRISDGWTSQALYP